MQKYFASQRRWKIWEPAADPRVTGEELACLYCYRDCPQQTKRPADIRKFGRAGACFSLLANFSFRASFSTVEPLHCDREVYLLPYLRIV